MSITLIGPAAPLGADEQQPESPQELSFREKLKAIADNPNRELSIMERIATSAPGRAILGTMTDVGEHPVPRGVASAPVNIAQTASDLYLGATQKTYEVAGFEDAAKEVEDVRLKARGIADEIEQFNARQDKQYKHGETSARVLRGATAALTDVFTMGGVLGRSRAAWMGYGATRDTQEALRRNPGDWQSAVAHGLIGGISVGIGMKLGETTAKLAGTAANVENRLLARATSRIKDRIPLPSKAIEAVFGASKEAANELITETSHYFADVAAGMEKLDWNEYGRRMTEVAATAGLAGAAGESVLPIVESMRGRQEAIGSYMDEEMARAADDLARREVSLGLAKLPEPPPPTKSAKGEQAPKQTAEDKATAEAARLEKYLGERAKSFAGLKARDKLSDIAARESRVKKIEQDIDRYTTPKSAAQRALRNALGTQRIENIGQGEKGVEATGGEVDPNAVRNAPLRAADTKPAAVTEAVNSDHAARQSVINAELELLADFERQGDQLRRDLLDDANVQSPLREQLTADLENINATIAERLSKLADEDAGASPEIAAAESQNVPTRTRAQRRIDALTRQVTDYKNKTRALRQRVKQRGEFDAQMVKDARTYLHDALPPNRRLRLEAAAANVNTTGKLDKFIMSVDKAVEKYNKDIAKKSLAAAVKKARKYATRPEDRATIDDLISPIDYGPKRVREQADALLQYVAENPQAEIPPGYTDAIQKSQQIPVSELSADETRQLAEAIEAVAARASAQQTFLTIARDQSIDQYAAGLVSQINTNRPRPSGATGELMSAAANMVYRPETIMAGLSEDLRVLGWENIGVEAARNQLAYTQTQLDDMTALLESRGLSPSRSLDETLQGGSALNSWRYGVRSIGGQPITRAEAMHIYGLAMDPEAAAILAEGGATLAKTKGLRKKLSSLAINEGTLREIGEFLGQEGRDIVEHGFARINTTMRDAVNKEWLGVYNRNLSDRNNYFPIRRDADWVMDSKAPEDFLVDLQQAALDQYGEFGITKRRTGAASPLEVGDFFDVYSRHIDTTSRIHAYMAPVRDFFAVYGKSEVKQAITNVASNSTYEGILEAVKQQVLPVGDPDSFSRLSRKIVRGSGAAILGFRLVTPYKNAIGMVAAQSYYAGGEMMMAKALATMARPAEVNRMEALLQQNSPSWRQRVGHYQNEATSGMAGESRSFQPADIPSATLFHVATTDKFAGIARGFMAEQYVRDTLGIPPDAPEFSTEVAKEWERLLYRTESTSHGLEMSGALRAGKRHGLVGSFVQFGSGSSKTLSLVPAGVNDIRAGQYKRGVKKLASFGTAVVTDAVIGALFAATAAGQEEELVDRIAASAARLVPGIGEYINLSYRQAKGLKTFSGPNDSLQTIALDTAIGASEAYKMVESYLTGGLTDEGDPKYQEHATKAADRLSLLVGAVTKLPTEGLKDISGRVANSLGIEGSEKDSLAAAIRRLDPPADIKEPRNKIKAAIMADNDAMFLEALEEIHTTAPERLSPKTLKGVIDGMFRDVARIEANPQLVMNMTDSELRAVRHLVEERKLMTAAMRDMIARNLGQIQAIARDR